MPSPSSNNDDGGKKKHVRGRIEGKNPEDKSPSHVLETYRRFLHLSGGHLCLDFVNTIKPRVGKNPHDMVTTYADLVLWSHYVGLLSKEKVNRLLEEAQSHQKEAEAVFVKAMNLREATYSVFSAHIHHASLPPCDLETLQKMFVEAMNHGHLEETGHGIGWQWSSEERNLEQLLWPLSRSVVELLTSSEVTRVKECPHWEGGCGWLFLDRSKNGSRRWCSDEECGSVVRMRRLYARKRASKNT